MEIYFRDLIIKFNLFNIIKLKNYQYLKLFLVILFIAINEKD